MRFGWSEQRLGRANQPDDLVDATLAKINSPMCINQTLAFIAQVDALSRFTENRRHGLFRNADVEDRPFS